MRAPPLRVGLVGCGGIGARHAEAVRAVEFARLTGCHDIDPAAARRVADRHGCAEFGSVDALLGAGIDVMCVATPDDRHADPVLAALAAGCAVFCEKPLATTLGEARRMRDAARSVRRPLGVDYNRRYGFGYRMAREAVDQGRIGAVRAACLRVVDGIPSAYGPGEWSALRTLATHHIDLLRWFCGEITTVATRAGAIAAEGRRHQIGLMFDHAGGAVSTLSIGLHPGQARTAEWCEIAGDSGAIVVDDVVRECAVRGLDPDVVQRSRPDAFHGNGADFPSTIDLHIARFLAAVRMGGPAPVPAEEGVRGLQVVDAAIRSFETGKVVDVAPVDAQE